MRRRFDRFVKIWLGRSQRTAIWQKRPKTISCIDPSHINGIGLMKLSVNCRWLCYHGVTVHRDRSFIYIGLLQKADHWIQNRFFCDLFLKIVFMIPQIINGSSTTSPEILRCPILANSWILRGSPFFMNPWILIFFTIL